MIEHVMRISCDLSAPSFVYAAEIIGGDKVPANLVCSEENSKRMGAWIRDHYPLVCIIEAPDNVLVTPQAWALYNQHKSVVSRMT